MPTLQPVTLPRWMLRAVLELRVAEIPGRASNARILEYFKVAIAAGAPAVPLNEDIAWCAAFQNWCLAKEGLPSTKSHAAKSFLKFGDSLPSPVPGAFCVFDRPGANVPSWQGHVAQFISKDKANPTLWHVLGANQNNRVSIARWDSRLLERDGIRYPSNQILIANVPFDMPLTETSANVSDR